MTSHWDDHDGSPVPAIVQLSLVIPAYNEALRLEAGFARLNHAMEAGAISPQSTQFIVVDDGSSDDTSGCARSLFGSLPHAVVLRLPKNRGKGAAVRAGVTAASAPTIAFADADMAIDPEQTPQFLDTLRHSDLAIGSRAASGASVDRPSIRRSVMNRTFNQLVNAVTRVSLNDTQCGFKAFRGPVARLLFHCSVTERMAFDVELLALARQFQMSIAEVPVHWLRVRGSRVSSWSDSGSMIRDVLRARRRMDRAPSVPGVEVRLPPGQVATGSAYLRELATIWPVIHRGGTDFLVLFPLADQAQAAVRADVLGHHLSLEGLSLAPVSASSLRDLAPLTLSWDDALITSRSV
jgi:Glycosyl transferase family 2